MIGNLHTTPLIILYLNQEVTTLLAGEVGGNHCILSKGTSSDKKRYLGSWVNKTFDLQVGTSPQCNKCEQWTIEERPPPWQGKVTFYEACTEKYLRGHEGYLDHSGYQWEPWTPHENEDGSWSFSTGSYAWLQVDDNGKVSSSKNVAKSEHKSFWIEPWPENDVPQNVAAEPSTSIHEYLKIFAIIALALVSVPVSVLLSSYSLFYCRRWSFRKDLNTPLPSIPGSQKKRELISDRYEIVHDYEGVYERYLQQASDSGTSQFESNGTSNTQGTFSNTIET